jgi:hypothetical protein
MVPNCTTEPMLLVSSDFRILEPRWMPTRGTHARCWARAILSSSVLMAIWFGSSTSAALRPYEPASAWSHTNRITGK